MTMTDPIADLLTRIRNGAQARKRWVDIPSNNLKVRMALLLKLEGYIKDFVIIEETPQNVLRVYMKYDDDGVSVIDGIRRISKPGRRIYAGAGNIPRVRGGLGVAFITTSSGVITDKQARKENVGGEVLCEVW
jgi:small subunit ribosomal protein S8